MFNVIVNMYKGTKSCIMYKDSKSDYFPCSNGVRRGENLSLFLFALYINDLESFLEGCYVEGLKSISDELESHLNLYIKLFAILYADDTVLPSQSANDLQKQLNSMSEYCNFWKLRVNIEKSKVMIFSRGQLPKVMNFLYNGKQLEIVKDFNYLGVVLTRTGNFKKAKQCQIDKATKAFYEVLKLGRVHNLSISCQLDLFDKMVKPTLLFGCEVWGCGNNEMLERVQLNFVNYF